MEPLEFEFGVTAKMNTWSGEMKLRSLVLCVLFIMGTAGQVYGQGGGVGTILGTISDSSAAIIAKAKVTVTRSEERRVGKECRCRVSPEHEKKEQAYG